MRLAFFLLSIAALCAQPSNLAEKAQEAGALVVAGKADEAIPIYRELVRAFPNDPGLLVNLSIAEFKAKRYRDASGHAEAALKLQPDSPAANLFLGASYAELGEHARALPAIEKAIAAQPNDRNARVMMAESLLALDRYEEAVAQFQVASELAPENPKVWFGLGRSFEELSRRFFRQLDSTDPDSSYWFALAADAYLTQRRYGAAFACYRRALASRGALRGIHTGLSAVYRRTGHADWASIEEAAERRLAPPDCGTAKLACDFAAGRYRAIVEPASGGPEFWYWASKAYTELARQAYNRLAQLPRSLETHLHAAREFGSDGRDRQAASEWREALKLAPDNFEIQTGLVWSLYRGQDFEAALPLLSELTKNRPDSPELNFLCGASLLNLQQPEKAIPYLEATLRLDPQFLPAQAGLGHALLLAGNAVEAIAHLKAALAADQDGGAHFQLFRAYQITGQTSRARQALAEYQQARTSSEVREKMEEAGGITPP